MLAHSLPGLDISWKVQLFALVSLDRGVDGQRMKRVHGRIVHGAYDPGRTDNVPANVVLLAVFVQQVFLRVVEVWLKAWSWIGFYIRRTSSSDVDSVVLSACLENEPLGDDLCDVQSSEEILQQGGVGVCELLGVRPRRLTRTWTWLCIRIEEDVVGRDILVRQLLGNLLWFGEKIASDMFWSNILSAHEHEGLGEGRYADQLWHGLYLTGAQTSSSPVDYARLDDLRVVENR